MPSLHRAAALLVLTALLGLAALAGAPAASAQAHLTRVFPNLPPSDSWVTALRVAHNGDNRFYFAEQAGRIRSFVRDSTVAETDLYLDITDRVYANDSHGVLGLTFHPSYAANGYVYVTYISDGGGFPDTWRLSRFTAVGGASPPAADPASEVVLVEAEGTNWDHTGGDLHFGPDGYLYVSLGDSRCCGDPGENGQDPTNLLGAILRLDVDHPDPGLDYGIPADNPFVGNTQGWREEIFAYGFRNPWRFSVDPETGRVWVGDVGELMWEEVDLVASGGNYGWNEMEGPDCYDDPGCDPADYELPVWSYGRTDGFSITGGYVYRGSLLPALRGRYVFSDWGTQHVWALDYDPGSGSPPEVTLLQEESGVPASAFAVDEDGEIYAVHTFAGAIFQLTPAPPLSSEDGPAAEEPTLRLWPNPAATTLEVRAPRDFEAHGDQTVVVYDLLGRRLTQAPLQPACQCARLELDPAAFPPGVYLARVGALTRPFTVAR